MVFPLTMPVAPVTPAEVKTLIVKESDRFCDALVKLYRISIVIWKLVKFKYTASGALTPAYRTMMCAVDCPPSTELNSTTSGNPPT